jgi:hypothetical protein
LGNCIWKKGDLASAKNCFVLALNKVTLNLEEVNLHFEILSSIILFGRVQIRKYYVNSPCLKEVWLKVRMPSYSTSSADGFFVLFV